MHFGYEVASLAEPWWIVESVIVADRHPAIVQRDYNLFNVSMFDDCCRREHPKHIAPLGLIGSHTRSHPELSHDHGSYVGNPS